MLWVSVLPAMSESRVSQKTRQTVIERARGCCEYCRSQMRYSPDPFSVEHIVPRVLGGRNSPTNLALSCQGCNNLKYACTEAIDPLTGVLAPLFHPRQHRWSDHFAWSQILPWSSGELRQVEPPSHDCN